MTLNKSPFQQKLAALLIIFCLFTSLPALAEELQLSCSNSKDTKEPLKFLNTPEGTNYKDILIKKIQAKYPQAKIDCVSCHRDTAEQRAACVSTGCKTPDEGCPGTCAKPGNSNHQKVTTCDIKGLPGINQGCDILVEVCHEMKQKNPQGKCGIGGYPGGSHHLGFGNEINDSAWNQCSYVKSKIGQPVDSLEAVSDHADRWYKWIMHKSGARPDRRP